MASVVAVPLVALVFVGLGFVLHPLWWIAFALLVIWALGFTFREA